jgi:hypothetical protein
MSPAVEEGGMRGRVVGWCDAGQPDPSLTLFSDFKEFNRLFYNLNEAGS